MDVRNCRHCGKMFNYIGGAPLCPGCISDLEDKFQEVKKYIDDNKSASMQQVSEEMDVTISQIKRWVKEERLTFTEDSVIGIECESCGALIKTGRFCEACKEKLHGNLENAVRKPQKKIEPKKQKESAKMRFLDGK